MDKAEFDKFADEYYISLSKGIALSGEGPEYFSEYKLIDIARECGGMTASSATGSLRVLDFGAGIGNSVPYVKKHLPAAKLTCIDLSQRSLEVAEQRFPTLAEYVHFDGKNIPFDDNTFDISYAMCVFHHIQHEDHVELLKELRRVIRPGGSMFIFEHNPYNPLTVRIVNTCPFDENARLIRGSEMSRRLLSAGFSSAATRYRLFFPHVMRSFREVERFMAWLPLGGQYYARSIK